MKRQKRESAAAVIAAACLLLSGAFWPQAPRGAWWCTAFSITCSEAAEQNERDGETETDAVVFRWKLAEWWNALIG
ncbi:MAG: hypothetical protein Q4C72_03000 [Eubacteriales bacterium]|nr:hypothetical protein [Eubacteriales bacterium]